MNKEIEKFLKDRFVSDVGFADCSDSPYEGLNNAISLVFKLSDAIVEQIDNKPTHTYFHHYRTMNARIDAVMLELVMYLEAQGYSAASVPASQSINGLKGLYSHKKVAVKSKIGYIGKSALFISDKFGPRVRLGTVFTNAPLETKNELAKDRCGDCDICAKACKAMAINNIPFNEGMCREDIIDAKACSDYMKEKFKDIGRGVVCGVCMKVCPKGKKQKRADD